MAIMDSSTIRLVSLRNPRLGASIIQPTTRTFLSRLEWWWWLLVVAGAENGRSVHEPRLNHSLQGKGAGLLYNQRERAHLPLLRSYPGYKPVLHRSFLLCRLHIYT
ncbi:hypothetical protein BJY01DRAFT_222890 [Aspergillus pseudoustus]|uniref:Uncharacterized protein n=1 Tax=Aspergillus pseudoustus TaxID=1810923 RepID=A0ABR4J717_9EURO